MPLDVIQTLSDLVSLPSVNPMGRAADGPEYFEYRVTEYLEKLFGKLGVPFARQSVAPKRDNIIARIDGDKPPDQGGKLVMFEAHQDTVPVAGMTIEPWTPSVRDDRLYGRGACDIKGGMAAMLAAVARLADVRPDDMPTIIMACTVNEEHGYSGATELAKLWRQPGAIIPRMPDAAVVAEPTQLQVVVAHKGCIRWRCHAGGRATHSSQPHLGDSAIFKMARALEALERYQRDVVPTLASHPLCGHPTLNVGTIVGGLSVNTVPDSCTIEIDRRVVPGEDPEFAYRHAIDFLADATDHDPAITHDKTFLFGYGLSDKNNGPLAKSMLAAARRADVASEAIGVPYGTDAAVFGAAGVPCVVFGPGSIDQAHTADEWVPINQVQQAAEALYQFGCQVRSL